MQPTQGFLHLSRVQTLGTMLGFCLRQPAFHLNFTSFPKHAPHTLGGQGSITLFIAES